MLFIQHVFCTILSTDVPSFTSSRCLLTIRSSDGQRSVVLFPFTSTTLCSSGPKIGSNLFLMLFQIYTSWFGWISEYMWRWFEAFCSSNLRSLLLLSAASASFKTVSSTLVRGKSFWYPDFTTKVATPHQTRLLESSHSRSGESAGAQDSQTGMSSKLDRGRAPEMGGKRSAVRRLEDTAVCKATDNVP